MSKMFMNVKEVMEVLEVSESYAYKLMKRQTGNCRQWDARQSQEKLNGSIFMSSSMEQDRMMGGIRDGNLQE